MDITVSRFTAIAGGAKIALTVELSEDRERQTITGAILAEMIPELHLPWEIEAPFSLDRDTCDALLFQMKKTAAIEKGISLIDYAQCTEKSMKNKLMLKGFPREAAEEAAAYLAAHGWIDERRDATFFVETLATHKKFGKSRIQKELYAKGFASEVIREVLAELEFDFSQTCAERIRGLGGAEIFADRERKQKAVAALFRYGFSFDDIREALTVLQEEE